MISFANQNILSMKEHKCMKESEIKVVKRKREVDRNLREHENEREERETQMLS